LEIATFHLSCREVEIAAFREKEVLLGIIKETCLREVSTA